MKSKIKCKECRKKNKKIQEKEPFNNPFTIINAHEFNFKSVKNPLYIIGNGFDLMHGVKSSYNDFSKTIGKHSPLRFTLETYIHIPKEELWGNFEDSLAHIDRGAVLFGIDLFLDIYDVKEEDDDDFKASEFYLAIDSTLLQLDELVEKIPIRFKKWIESLSLPNSKKLLSDIINKDAKYINFNYTEFLETLYEIKKENIMYIHGDRRNKKDKLVLGHGHTSDEMYEKWYQENKGMKISSNDIVSLAYFYEGNSYKMWKSQTRFDATQRAIERIEDYYDISAKKTQDVLNKNSKYFEALRDTKTVIVIGHSLSFVDYPYFKHMIELNSDIENMEWIISYYTNNDIKRIYEFAQEMNIKIEKIKIFKV